MTRHIVFNTLFATLSAYAPLQCQLDHISCVSNELGITITEKLQLIPADELQQLRELFEHWFLHRGFSYTLFGDKPISCDCSFHEHLDGLFQGSKEQFRIWENYMMLFPLKKYIFLFYENDLSENHKYEVTFINKAAFVNIFEKYRDKFIDSFGTSITAEKLLNLLIEKKSLWNTPVKDREDLMGILFGYGKINAELYQRREEIDQVLMHNEKKQTKEKNRGVPRAKKRIHRMRIPSSGFASFEEELQAIDQRLGGLYPDNPQIRRMSLPGFVADYSHRETKALIKKYKQQRKQILEKFKDGSVLETSLLQLCSD